VKSVAPGAAQTPLVEQAVDFDGAARRESGQRLTSGEVGRFRAGEGGESDEGDDDRETLQPIRSCMRSPLISALTSIVSALIVKSRL